MNVLLKKARILDTQSPFHNSKKDILIQNGIISKIADTIKENNVHKTIVHENMIVSCGWFDSSVSFGEPGFEERENINNGLITAAKSGFTAIAVNPNTNPIVDTKADVAFIKNKAINSAVNLYPIGALTKNSQGKELAELYDMQQSGAVAFGDYKKSITNDNLMKIALQYAQNFDGVVLSFPKNNSIAGEGIANEGHNSTRLGLKGSPALAEHLQIARDLFLLEYTGGKLHIPTISTKESLALITQAKTKGLQVTCSVAVHNLILDDSKLEGFDSNYKVNPPLRTKEDIEALQEGVKNGFVDVITSDHNPIDIENKKLEFSMAEDGTIGLETAFSALNTVFEVEDYINCITSNPRKIFNISNSPIQEGEVADLTLFSTTKNYTLKKQHILSTSKNSAFLGEKLKGKVIGIFANNQLIINK